MKEYNLIIVGGGAAGILCAIEANKKGIDNIFINRKRSCFRWSFKFRNADLSRENAINGQRV